MADENKVKKGNRILTKEEWERIEAKLWKKAWDETLNKTEQDPIKEEEDEAKRK